MGQPEAAFVDTLLATSLAGEQRRRRLQASTSRSGPDQSQPETVPEAELPLLQEHTHYEWDS